MLRKCISAVVLVAFIGLIPAESGYAQLVMPQPGAMVHQSNAFTPALMMGLRVDVKDPFNFSFVMSNGQQALLGDAQQEEYRKLIKYFMASLITPNKDMWVNLSPLEADRIIPDNFSMTEMGRDLLAQDYLLKQFTASLMSPETALGKDFWDQVYRRVFEMYGTTDVPVDTFNKVWITADKADIYQKNDTALLTGSHLKVMLEQDFMAIDANKEQFSGVVGDEHASMASRSMASDVVRRLIVPLIEKEVNEGENFAQVRQVYHSMILATWFKKTLKDSLLGQIYADQDKVAGIALNDPDVKERIYQQYLQAYKTGVFNYIKEEFDTASQEMLPRKYFSGGIVAIDEAMINTDASQESAQKAMAESSKMSVASVTMVNAQTGEGFINKQLVVPPVEETAPVVDVEKLNVKLAQIDAALKDTSEDYSQAIEKLFRLQAPLKRLLLSALFMISMSFSALAAEPVRDFFTESQHSRASEMAYTLQAVSLDTDSMVQAQSFFDSLVLQVPVELATDSMAAADSVTTIEKTDVAPVQVASVTQTGKDQVVVGQQKSDSIIVSRQGNDTVAVPLAVVPQVVMVGGSSGGGDFPPEGYELVDSISSTTRSFANTLAQVNKDVAPVIAGQMSGVIQGMNALGATIQKNDSVIAANQDKFDQLSQENQKYQQQDLPVDSISGTFTPNAATLKYIDDQIDQMRTGTWKQELSPINAFVGINGNMNPVSAQLPVGGGISLNLGINYPGSGLVNLGLIVNGMTQFSSQTITGQIAGPLFGAQMVADLTNYVAKHQARGLDGGYPTFKYDGNKKLGKAIASSILPYGTKISYRDDNGKVRKSFAWNVGLVKTYQAAWGKLDKLLGGKGWVGNSQQEFPFVDVGWQLQAGDYEKSYKAFAWDNDDKNVFAVQIYTIDPDTTRYRMNKYHGWSAVKDTTTRDPRQDFRSATVTGFILRMDTTNMTISGQQVHVSPTFVTDAFARGLGGDLTKPFVEFIPSVDDLKMERQLEVGVDAQGKTILAAECAVTGRIKRFITDPRELNGMTTVADGQGNKLRFIPGKAVQKNKVTVLKVIGDYLADDTKGVFDQWASIHNKGKSKSEVLSLANRPAMTAMPKELEFLLNPDTTVVRYSGPMKYMDQLANTGDNLGTVYFNDGRMPALVKDMQALKTLQYAYENGVKTGVESGVTRTMDTLQYQIEGFARRTLPGNALVMVENGRVIGIFSATANGKKIAMADIKDVNDKLAERNAGLSEYGIATDIKTGAARNLMTRPDDFRTAKSVGVAGELITVHGEDGTINIVKVSDGMMVKVDANGHVVEILEAGFKMMRDYGVILQTVMSGGLEVENLATGGVSVYAKGNELSLQQIEAGVKPERELVKFVAANQTKMVQVEGAKEGVERMVILKQPRPTKLGNVTIPAETLKEFNEKNLLIVWKDNTVEFASPDVIKDNNDFVVKNKKEIIRLGEKGPVTQNTVLLFNGSRQVAGEGFLDSHYLIVYTNGPARFATMEELKNNGDAVAGSAKEILQLDATGATIGRVVAMYDGTWQVTSPEFFKSNYLIVFKDKPAKFATMADIEQNSDVILKDKKEILQLNPNGGTIARVVPMYKGGWQVAGAQFYKEHQLIVFKDGTASFATPEQVKADGEALWKSGKVWSIGSQKSAPLKKEVATTTTVSGQGSSPSASVAKINVQRPSSQVSTGKTNVEQPSNQASVRKTKAAQQPSSQSSVKKTTAQRPLTTTSQQVHKTSTEAVAKVFTISEQDLGGENVRIFKSVNAGSGALERTFGVILPSRTSLGKDSVGREYVQFYPTVIHNGSAVSGKAIVGLAGTDRKIYSFVVEKGQNGKLVYKINWNDFLGTASQGSVLNIQAQDKKALGLDGVSIAIADELNSSGQLARSFIINTATNEHIGTINPLRYGNDGRQYYEAEIFTNKSTHVTYLLSSRPSTAVKGSTNIFFKQLILTAENQTEITLSELQGRVGVLSEKLMASARAIATESGIAFENIRIVPSISTNEGNGQNIFYRIKDDPLARVLVFQKDPKSSWFMVNTLFEGIKASQSYELTSLGEVNYVKTTETRISRAQLEQRLGLDGIEDLKDHQDGLSYRHFDEFIEITSYRLTKGLVHENAKDEGLIRYVAAGDPMSLDLVKVESGSVRLMKYDDVRTLNDRPINVVSGEVAVLPAAGAVSRVTEWVGHDKTRKVFSYRPVYERNSAGVFNDPKIVIDYNYITGVVAERFKDKDYIYYSLNGMPLMNRTTAVTSWQKLVNWVKGVKDVERDQTAFEVRVMHKDGLTYRLVREVNIEGATAKEKLQVALFVNDQPIAVKNGKDISLNTFENTRSDVMRNGLPGSFVRSLGGDKILGFEVELKGAAQGNNVTVNVKDIMEEMESPVAAHVDVLRLDVTATDKLIDQGVEKVAAYHNWIMDVLKPFNFIYLGLAAFALSFMSLFKGRNRKFNMNVVDVGDLLSLESNGVFQKVALLPKGVAQKWNVFRAANNSLVVKEYQKDGGRGAACTRLENRLRASGGFFADNEIIAIVDLFRQGKISFDEVRRDPQRDIAVLPSSFDIDLITGDQKGHRNALPLAALRYAFNNDWLSAEELEVLMREVSKNTTWSQEVGLQWTQLFSLARIKLFEQAVKGEKSLEQTFPDPEVGMYRSLLDKGYDDIQDYVSDQRHGANAKQRVESYVRERILLPMARQIRTEIPVLGDSMLDIRKEPLEDAVVSEFYRFAMIDPAILPDADKRDINGDKVIFNDPAVFDQVYNPNIVLPYSEPSTFREKIVYHLLMMPISETKEISLGPVGAIAPMTVFLTRNLIRRLQAVEQSYSYGQEYQRSAKEEVIREFANHTRFWKGVFATSNWGSIFGNREFGLFKRITEPGGNVQPNIFIKDLVHDENMYYLFERLQEEADPDAAYDQLVNELMNNDEVLQASLAKAGRYLEDGGFLEKKAKNEKDPQRLALYLDKLKEWRSEQRGLSAKPVDAWTMNDRLFAMALSSDTLFWEVMQIKMAAEANEELESFVHSSFSQVMTPITKKNEEYRLKRNSYAYLVNELTSTSKGDGHLWLFRRIIPKVSLELVSHWLAGKLAVMKFKAREFNATISAKGLVDKINANAAGQLATDDPVKSLNQLLLQRDLYAHPGMQRDSPKAQEIRDRLMAKGLNQGQLERLNRRLIEANYPLDTPRSVEFIKADGTKNFTLKNSLEHYWGIKSKATRYAITAARTILTPLAIWLACTTSVGLGLIIFSAAWFLPPLIFGKVKVKSEKSFWISVLALATANIALCAELLFGKFLITSFTAFGTYVTGALLAILVPVTVMTSYYLAGFVKSFRVYQSRVWSKYWLSRTIGGQSWLMFRPIQNWSKSGHNFAGVFYGQVLRDILDLQRQRGSILPSDRLVQDKLIDDFNKIAKHTLLSPNELKGLLASVNYMANYRKGIKKGDQGWDELVKAARSYEAAIHGLGKKSFESLSDEELVSKNRPFEMITPRDPEAQEFMYTNFQSIVMKKPEDEVFARLQGVTTHEQSYNEVATFPLENYGRLGTGNIAGLREFMPQLRQKVAERFKDEEIKAKYADIVQACNVDNYPFTFVNIIKRTKTLTDEEKKWLEAVFKQAKDEGLIAETSLFGYALRVNPEKRSNMLEALVAQEKEGASDYTDLKEVLEKAEETDDVTVLFQKWAKGRDAKAVQVAEEVLAAFLNAFLPNNLSMVVDIADDVFHMHLAAATAYGDLEYYNKALQMYRQYGALAAAAEKTDDALFKQKFKFYQHSVKLKTNGMLQYGVIWGSNKEFRLVEKYEDQENFDRDLINIADYNYVSKAAEEILKLGNATLKARFQEDLQKASLDPRSGVRLVQTKDGSRNVVFCKEMRDFSRLFLEFREKNYADILALPAGGDAGLLSDTYEIMKYVEESARSEALIPFYDKRTDDIIPGNKNGGINLNAWMNLGRSWNMDAAVRGYLGQSLYRQTYAALVGRNPEIVIVNPSFRIWTSSNNAYPGVSRYKIAQETFTQDAQRARPGLLTFYGKGGILQPAGNAMFTTPGEDSANFIIAMMQNPDLVSIQEDWMVWYWGRPSLHKESIAGSELRYTANVTRFEMDIALFELYLDPDVGYDVKLTNDHMFNHYLYATVSSVLLILLPALQGFSGFAFLAPAVMFVPLSFMAMQSGNFLNFLRHWRQEGSVAKMLWSGAQDVLSAFSYYVSMITTFTKGRVAAANETFSFIPTVKTMIFGSLDREARFNGQSRWIWAANDVSGLDKKLKWGGLGVIVTGILAWGLSSFGIISANLAWLGPLGLVVGGVLALFGFVFQYRYKTKEGKNVGAIGIPFDTVVGALGILSWGVGFFATTTLGPFVTILYLLASIAPLTGGNVYDTFTKRVKNQDGEMKLRIKGQNHWAMFTDKPAMLLLFMGSLAAVCVVPFLPIAAVALPWINLSLYGVMMTSVFLGAFNAVFKVLHWTWSDLGRYVKEVNAERKNRNNYEAQQVKKKIETAPDPRDAAQLTDPSENIRLEADKAEALRQALATAQNRAGQIYLKWKALLAQQKYLKDKIAEAVAASLRGENRVPQTDEEYGGINLSEEHLTINIKVDGDGMPLPAQFQDMAMINIQGLSPVIRGIAPINSTNMPVLVELMK